MVAEAGLFCLCDGYLQKAVLRISPVGVPDKIFASYAFPRFYRPLHANSLHWICRRQRAGNSTQQATLVGLIRKENTHPNGWVFSLTSCTDLDIIC